MRNGGILMHISSLPSPYGIGTLGREAYEFIDFLKDSGQKYWQVLPLCQTSFGDSPYQSFSGFAGNPYFIDLTTLCEEGYLEISLCNSYEWGDREDQVDYGLLYQNRYALFRVVFERFCKNEPEDFKKFCEEQAEWLTDYALFMALKDAHNGQPWYFWEEPLKKRESAAMEAAKIEYADEMKFWKMLQYLFYQQWNRVKTYANERNIEIIGDVPIYVAGDSADVWGNTDQFYLDENLEMIEVAGCPPDAFSKDGQLWGNPLYRWDVMKDNGYIWWITRLNHMSKLYDVVRIDHFRGFESYYAIPAGEETAMNGQWRKGPGAQLFHVAEEKLGKLNIIVEDLGYLTDGVRRMVEETGYPGMKLMQFAFDTREEGNYMPHHYIHNCIVYTGTHDNDTILGWENTAPQESVQLAKDYLHITEEEGMNWGMMRGTWASVGKTAIVTMQDVLGLGSSARMNVPSKIGGNWQWRMLPGKLNSSLSEKLYSYMILYERLSE